MGSHDEQLKIETSGYALKHSLHTIPLENVRVIDKSEDKIKMETVLLHLLIYLTMKYLYEVHNLTGQLAGRRFSSADRRQEASGSRGLWIKTTYAKSCNALL